MTIKSVKSPEHFKWGNDCDGWNLFKEDSLSVIKERMPYNTAEEHHYHEKAQQVFYILKGRAEFDTDGITQTVCSGQSISISPKTLHRISNNNPEELEFLVISSPSTAGDRIEIINYSDEYRDHIYRLNAEWLLKYFRIEPPDEVQLSNPREEIIEKGGMIFYSRRNGEITGTVTLMKKTEESYELGKMAVTENAQGHFTGNALIKHCLNVAKKKKIIKLLLYSNTKLDPAIHLYRKYGFAEVKSYKGNYERANIRMEKIL
ncbi:MAG: GNAT family N-acetyltransferase [Ignavibacteria bacterium]|nr:GNAT family N-acetyltransferase [Ignavibacteria bacterium]